MTLILGGGGQLATAFRHLLPEAEAPTRAEFDIADLDELPRRLDEVRPSLVVNCAAYTAVDGAEDQMEMAHVVNAAAVGVLAHWCSQRQVRFVTFSTDYVFDGTGTKPYVESSTPNPVNVYGRTKLAGEHAALTANPDTLIVRTSWVFSSTHRNFVTALVERAANGPVDVVADQTGCPTYAPDLAAATMQAVTRDAIGLLHITNTGATTWFDLAVAACAAAGVDTARVSPITSDQYMTRARRPRYSVLGSERLASLDIAPLRPWQDAVREALTPTEPA